MKVIEEDSPAIYYCKCAISMELNRRQDLDNTDPANPGSDFLAACLDLRFKQGKFLDSHKWLHLQLTITKPAHPAKASFDSDPQEEETTTAEKETTAEKKTTDKESTC